MNHAVEEEQCGEGLVLGGGGDVTLDGERREELHDFPGPHLGGMALTMEEDVAPDPAHVGLLGPPAAVEGLERLSDAVEEPGFFFFFLKKKKKKKKKRGGGGKRGGEP